MTSPTTSPGFDPAADAARDARHRDWLATYQEGAAGEPGSLEHRRATRALESLAADVAGPLEALARELAHARFRESDQAAQATDEAFAALWGALPEAAARFDANRCAGFLPWFIGRAPGPGRQAVFEAFDDLFGLSGLGGRERRALNIAQRASAQLTQELGATPSTEQLQLRMWELAYEHELGRMSEQERRLDDDEQMALARARIVNNSLRANIERIEDLRKAASRSASLDESPLEVSAPGWAEDAQDETVDELLRAALSGVGPERVVSLLDGEQAPTRLEISAATGRLMSAHGQYAFLAPDLPAQVFTTGESQVLPALV